MVNKIKTNLNGERLKKYIIERIKCKLACDMHGYKND